MIREEEQEQKFSAFPNFPSEKEKVDEGKRTNESKGAQLKVMFVLLLEKNNFCFSINVTKQDVIFSIVPNVFAHFQVPGTRSETFLFANALLHYAHSD